ncbi:hypothetical protein M3P36_12770 [Altererythrobacter sp. KTW20L]|uniref:hypothetical protein n=1 Tax=Altererythrobacter sp. KTW20L TaxID=2942210 RepID=UPI0020C08521|nr:hypothetical protein [Altererythrobacter sp. KTW20L]MCL6251912.1 hypothetical protein [Altererythrobacter sp. KTW20L]
MIRSLSLAALAALVVSTAIPAEAQNTQNSYRPTGTRIISQQEEADPDYSRRLLKETAACVNRYDSSGVVGLLRGGNQAALDYAAGGIRNEDRNSPLKISECLHEALNGAQLVVHMRIPPAALRTVLAEQAYLNRHTAPLTIAPGSPQVLEGRIVIGGDTAEESQARGIFADCLVFNAPVEADRLLRGPVGGGTELDNARALMPAISQCLNDGQAANFSPNAIRDFVADGLWARSEALAGASAAQ